jgi:hypothetical protein
MGYKLYNMSNTTHTMLRLPHLMLALVVSMAWAACSRENQIIVIDHPPVVDPDTTLLTYYANISIGNDKVPADTIFTDMQYDDMNPGLNQGYNLTSLIGEFPSFVLFWPTLSPLEEKITAGTYSGCCSVLLNDSSRVRIEQWVLNGKDPSAFPTLDSVVFNYYDAFNVMVEVSNVEESVRVEDLGNGMTWIVDRAKIKLSGIMINTENNTPRAISGNFTCYFGRQGQ